MGGNLKINYLLSEKNNVFSKLELLNFASLEKRFWLLLKQGLV